MEPAELAVARLAIATGRPIKSRRGRLSSGLERLPESPAKLRVGRFSSGLERLPESPAKLRVGRFSSGLEQPESSTTLAADGANGRYHGASSPAPAATRARL